MNLPTILTAVAVLAVLIAIAARSIQRRQRGKNSCACNGDCSCCPYAGK